MPTISPVRARLEDGVVILRLTTFNEQTFPELEKQLKEQVDAAGGMDKVTGFVIDLRNNTGGNSAVLSERIPRILGHPPIAGRVLVLIGPATYSSEMMNAQQLRDAGATLVGEPTGGKPNSWGELRSFRLPRSGLQVFYSTKYFRMLADDPPAVVLIARQFRDHRPIPVRLCQHRIRLCQLPTLIHQGDHRGKLGRALGIVVASGAVLVDDVLGCSRSFLDARLASGAGEGGSEGDQGTHDPWNLREKRAPG